MRLFHFAISLLLSVGLDKALGVRVLLLAPSLIMNSHLLELLAIGDELATRGHDVYVPICSNGWPIPENATKRLPTLAVKELEYRMENDDLITEMQAVLAGNLSKASFMYGIVKPQEILAKNVRHLLQDAKFMKTTKELMFDLAVVDGFFLAPYFLLVAHVLGIPYVTSTAQINPYVGGSPLLPSLHSNALLNDAEQHSFKYRLLSLVSQVGITVGFKLVENGLFLFAEFAPDVHSWKQLTDQSMLFFITRDHVLDHPQPYFPNVISTPPITLSPPKPLSGEFEKVYAEATSGVILVSFGSMSHIVSKDILDNLMSAFGQLKETVVMRVARGIQLENRPKNVKTFSWLPQNDLLARSKLFITHGGNNGVYESLYHGVPMIAFPFFADQPFQVKLIEARGYGLWLDVNSFTPEQLVKAITDVLTNFSYSTNVKKASAILKDRPMTPRQTVAYWIEHVIKHGYQHLRSHAMDLAWYEYFMVDVLVCVSGIVGVLLVVIWYIVRCCCRCFCNKKKTPKVKTN